jgi:hypothetical protein
MSRAAGRSDTARAKHRETMATEPGSCPRALMEIEPQRIADQEGP